MLGLILETFPEPPKLYVRQIPKPLEIRNGDATSVEESVRYNHNPSFLEDCIGTRSCRSIRGFSNNRGFDSGRVFCCKLILKRGWHEDIALQLQTIVRILNNFSSRIPLDGSSFFTIHGNFFDVKSLWIIDATISLNNPNDACIRLHQELGGMVPDITETLDNDVFSV